MGVLKKYIRAYLLAYGILGVVPVSLVVLITVMVMFGCDFITNKMYSEVLGKIIAVLFFIFFPGCPLCYAFPEFKRNIKPALVRIIILGLLGWFLFFVFCVVCRIAMKGIDIGPSLFMIVLIVVPFSFFWVYKSSFYVWFAGEKIKFKKVLIDFGVTIVLSLLFFFFAGLLIAIEEKIEGVNDWLGFFYGCLLLFSLYSLVITDVVRGYFVRRGEVKKPSEELVVATDVSSNSDNVAKVIDSVVEEEEVVSIKEEEVIEKEEKEVVRESELPIVQSGSCGENVCYKLTADSTLTIFGQGPMCDYDYKNVSPFKDMEVRKVIIEKGVTKIGDMSFMGCSSLEDLVIADSVTEIGVWSFGYCENLRSLSIPKSVKSIRCRAFRCCNKSLVVNFAKKVKTIEDNAFDEEVFMGK